MKQRMAAQSLMLLALTFASAAHAQGTDDGGDDFDDPVAWIIDEGFSTIHFMKRCVSLGPDGSVVSDAPLPVGGDHWLLCNTYGPVQRDATEVQANDGEVYCVLGSLSSIQGGGDDRLSLDILSSGAWGSAWVSATAKKPIEISMVSAFGGAQAWPVWLNADYDTEKVVPVPGDGRTCSQVFGLSD